MQIVHKSFVPILEENGLIELGGQAIVIKYQRGKKNEHQCVLMNSRDKFFRYPPPYDYPLEILPEFAS